MAVSVLFGYYLGKGKIEIQKKLTEEEKKMLEESEARNLEALEKYNDMIRQYENYEEV